MLVAIHADSYEAAGFPTLVSRIGRERLARLSFTWICATAASCALLPVFRAVASLPALLLVGAGAVWLVRGGTLLLKPVPGPAVFRTTFLKLNAFVLLLTATLVVDALLAPLAGGR
jgi:heme O synthase-like polyprenyltransferase